MSDMEKNQSAACDGDCTSCGSSCGFGESDATVTLTLDDDTTIECAVLTIYPAGGREYIALLPLDENGENQDGEVYLYRFVQTTIECAVLTIYPAGGREYIALLPLDENGENQDGEVYLYRFVQGSGEEPMLENIEDDEEYETASDAFDELLDKAEFDELVEEE